MATRVLTSADLSLYKRLRLAALHTDPGAFASTYDREFQFDDATWLSRMSGFDGRAGVVLVDEYDEYDGNATGIVGIGFGEGEHDTYLWGMWVAPQFRRSGAGQRLVMSAIEWARVHRAATVTLWVVRSNSAAIALYERNGFEPTGEVDTLPNNPCIEEMAMQRRLLSPNDRESPPNAAGVHGKAGLDHV